MSAEDPLGRLFIGAALTTDATAAIATHLAPLSPLPGRPGPPANWHITLRFLGDTTRLQLERVQSRLIELPGPAPIRFEGLGSFPSPRKATVLWLGADAPALHALAALAESAAVAAGFAPEERPFHPHLTLSRLRPPQDIRALLERSTPIGLNMPLEHLTIFRSTSTDDGVRYDAVDTLPLG